MFLNKRVYLGIWIVLIGVVGCSNQSPTGRGQLLMFDQAQMRQMGLDSFAQIKASESITDDPQILEYVQCVTEALTQPELLHHINPNQQEQWEVVVFESEQANAFALPGGHIGIYTGLLHRAKTAAQLAAIVGHEIGHVLANHGNEQVSRNQATNIGLGVIQIALGASETTAANQSLIMAGLGLGAQIGILLPYGREQERESDVIGLELMARAGFNPAAAMALWQNMASASSSSPPQFLSTHPAHETRIDDLQAAQSQAQQWYRQAQQQGYRPQCVAPSS